MSSKFLVNLNALLNGVLNSKTLTYTMQQLSVCQENVVYDAEEVPVASPLERRRRMEAETRVGSNIKCLKDILTESSEPDTPKSGSISSIDDTFPHVHLLSKHKPLQHFIFCFVTKIAQFSCMCFN